MFPRTLSFRRITALLAVFVTASGAAAADSVLISRVTLIDTAGKTPRVVRDMDVLASDGRFVALGRHGTLLAPDDAVVIDGTDRWLIPGLADAHVHFDFDEVAADPDSQFVREPNDILGRLYVAHGVTFVRSMWGTPSIAQYRDRVNAGGAIGPSMTTTGPLLTQASIVPTRMLGTAEDVEAILDEHAAHAYDALKIHSSPNADACRLLLERAQQLEIPVYGHVPFTIGLRETIDLTGLATIEHVGMFVGACVIDGSTSVKENWPAMMAMYNEQDPVKHAAWAERARRSGKWFCPTLATSRTEGLASADFMTALDAYRDEPVTAATIAYWKRSVLGETSMYEQAGIDLSGFYDAPRAITRAFIAAKVPIIAGTDTPVRPGVAGRALLTELAEYVELGMTPYAALRSATVHVAEAVGQRETFGRIAIGLRADAVLLTADPLVSIDHLTRIDAVLLRGKLFDRAALDELLKDARARAMR